MCWAVSGPPWARRKHHGLVETPDLFSGFFPSTRNPCLCLCRRCEPHLPTGLIHDLAPWTPSIQEAESPCAWPSDQCLCLVPAVPALSGGVSVQRGSTLAVSDGFRVCDLGSALGSPYAPPLGSEPDCLLFLLPPQHKRRCRAGPQIGLAPDLLTPSVLCALWPALPRAPTRGRGPASQVAHRSPNVGGERRLQGL
jgi:hypothetical protein